MTRASVLASVAIPMVALTIQVFGSVQSQPAAPQTTSLLAGRVVDATSGAPLTNAIVTLVRAPSRAASVVPAAFSTRRVLVDRDGAFVFNRLPAGSYTIRAEKRGYAEGALGREEPSGATVAIDVRAGDIVTDLSIGLWKHAAIEGRILDDVGDPVSGFTVYAFRHRSVAGHVQLARAGAATTDDRGIFRVGSLDADEYVVCLPSKVSTSPLPVADGRVAVYPALYFPGTTDATNAQWLRLAAGEERTGVDLQRQVVPAVRVSGTLTGPDGPVANSTVRLRSATSAFAADPLVPIEVATSVSDATGAFTLVGVPPGTYVLKTESTPVPPPIGLLTWPRVLWASESVAVTDKDLRSLVVNLRAGMRVSGQLEFAGSTAPPTGAQVMRGFVWLLPAAGGLDGARAVGRAPLDASGRFSTVTVPGGQYILRIDSIGRWSMASAMLGGRDVADSPIDLATADVSDVIVTMSTQVTTLSGPVVDAGGAPDPRASVLVFPVDRGLWIDGGPQPRRLRAVRTDRGGTFAMDGLPPGEYYVAAVTGATAGDWQAPTILERLTRVATRVSLADGDRRTVHLRTVVRP